MFADHYSILEVGPNASHDEIEQAYRRVVRICHPDLHPHDESARARFQKVQAAFDVLHHARRRQQYDRQLEQADFRFPLGSLELFAEEPTRKNGEPLVTFTDEAELDHVRFRGQAPGTALRLYRPQSRLLWLRDWLTSSDFVLPLFFLLLLIGMHFTGVVLSHVMHQYWID